MRKTKTLQEWKEIGRQIKKTHQELIKLEEKMQGVPKYVKKEYWNVERKLAKLRSDLEERFCKEYPGKFDTKTFYG